MNLYTADLHFNHENVREYCGRPFSTKEEHDQAMIRYWNSVVSKSDTTYIIGDFGFGDKEYLRHIASQLNGRKYLISGNHDEQNRLKWNLLPYIQVIPRSCMVIINDMGRKALLVHDSADIGKKIQEEVLDIVDLVICGHVHKHWKNTIIKGKPIYNVGVDVRNYRPVRMSQL